MAFWDKFRQGARKLAANAGMSKEYKDVFDVEGVPAFREFYNLAIFPAKYVYRGLYNAWHVVNAPTIGNSKAVRTLFRMGMAKAICAELAGLIWSEGADIHITTANGDDPLERFVLDTLKKNAFDEKMQELIEQAAALGGAAMKEYVKVKRDDTGAAIAGTEKLMIDYCMADQFVPTAWDNAKVTEAVFVSRKAKDGMYWTRLEWHKWNGDTYVVTNDLYGTKQKQANGQNQDILGYWYPLNAAEQHLEPKTEIEGLTTSLFAYFRTPIANNIDDNSPLGISIYGNAFDTLHALDICYDSLVREFRLGKKRIIVPAAAVRTIIDPETGESRRYFDANDEAFEALATDDPDTLKVQDNSLELRVDEHIAALNALLSVLCLQVGFSASTFSFDMSHGLRTATEVISENSKTYKTIRTFQAQIKPAVERVCTNIIELGALYGMEFEGRKIDDLAKEYEISVTMEDAVLEDSSTRLDRAIKLVSNGFISKKTAMTDPKYGLGMTEEEADMELQQIKNEGQITAEAFDLFQSGTIE
jgi:A118 family predicted phage portal protein